MIENKIQEVIENLCQLYELTPPELVTHNLEKSLIEVAKWLTRLHIQGIKSERRMDG